VIQALFTIDAPDTLDGRIVQFMEEQGIELEDELIIMRVLRPDGRGRIYVNGQMVTLTALRQITAELVGITSQHEYHGLLKRDEHRRLLDSFGGLDARVSAVSDLWSRVKVLRGRLSAMKEQLEQAGQERERLREDAALIDRVAPRPGEEDELEGERRVLKASRELKELGHQLFSRLYAEKGSILELLAECRADLGRMARLDEALGEPLERLESIRIDTEDFAFTIRDYLEGLPVDMSRLDAIEDRLYELRQLKRRFGPETADVLAYREEIEARLEEHSGLELEIEEAERSLSSLQRRLCEEAEGLHQARMEAARAVEAAVTRELSSLNLEKTRFRVDVSAPEEIGPEDIGPYGADRVEFLFSANPDRPLAPLASVASGGELSRVMLAIQVVFARSASLPTVVFDEVDTGIGGEVAEKVGRKMAELSKSCQVLTITHFPQIAASGQSHFVVVKQEQGGRSTTCLQQVQGEERIQELVRMLGGEREAVRAYAEELLGTLFRGA
jgi:DNA repair protein RecN (Recombination protein N)